MSFLFVDRILELIPNERTWGVKFVTQQDEFLTLHHGKPILMSAILGEAIGQLLAWNIISSNDFRFRLVGGIIGEVNIHDSAKPGDIVILESFVDHLNEEDQAVAFHGSAKVNDKIIFTVENAIAPILPLSDFNDPNSVRQQFDSINHPGNISELQPKTTNTAVKINDYAAYHQQTIKDDSIYAEKLIDAKAPYFADHFPLKPVFPLSLLLQANLQLGTEFLQKHLNTDIIPVALKRIKIREFIVPGDVLQTTLTLQKQQDDQVILECVNKVADKKICTLTACFKIK